MHKVKISDLDRLYILASELGAISYLQGLIEYDSEVDVFCEQELTFAKNYAKSLLFDKQLENIIELFELLDSEDFSEKLA